jgi:hypothetical protein
MKITMPRAAASSCEPRRVETRAIAQRPNARLPPDIRMNAASTPRISRNAMM